MPWVQLKINFGGGSDPVTDVDFGLDGNAAPVTEVGLTAVESMGAAVIGKLLKPTETSLETLAVTHLESLKENLP